MLPLWAHHMGRTDGKEITTVSLSKLLANLAPLRPLTPPNFENIERTIRRVLDRFDAPPIASDRSPEDILHKMLDHIRNNDWRGVPLSFVIQSAGFAFSPDFRKTPAFEPIRFFLIKEVDASTRCGFINPMVRVYMESFDPVARHTFDLAAALQRNREQIGPRWQDLIFHIPDLFDPHLVSETIAERMDAMDDPWHGLRAIGLRQPHAPGLMDFAHLAFIRRIAPRLNQKQEIERLLGWLRPDGQTLQQMGAGAAINALLAPWRQQSPSKDISSLLTDRLTEFYGHPKVHRHPAWSEVDPELETMFLRWLMRADFRFLFRILDEVERGHMWSDREHFWETMLEQGVVDELWVAFNEEGYHVAQEKLPANTRETALRFGHQTGEKDKSLLLMRIGEKIVVEGTYNFKLHIFDADASGVPELYKSQYDVARIRRSRCLDSFAHRGDWQTRARRSIL